MTSSDPLQALQDVQLFFLHQCRNNEQGVGNHQHGYSMPDPHQLHVHKAQRHAPQQKTSMVEAEIMEQAMRDAIQEVMLANKAKLMASATQGGQPKGDEDDDGSSEDQQPTGLHGTRTPAHNVGRHAVEEVDQGGPNNSPWGRRALGDDWYDERCIRCCVCRRPVCASVRAKRGQRCAGCLRWFHDKCAPAGTLPTDKHLKECDPTTSGYHHCASCSTVRQRLQQGAESSCGKELGGGCSVTLIDLHSLRQMLKPGPYSKDDNRNDSVPSGETKPGPRTSKPFKRIAKQELKTLKQLGPQYLESPILDSLRQADNQQQQDSIASGPPAILTKNSGRRRGLADLQAVVNIFKTYDREANQDDIMEDTWAALLHCNNIPVSAASLLVMGSDHARLQALITPVGLRRQGHARALLSEVGSWLAGAGVTRLVAILPEREPGRRDNDDGETALKRLRFKTLQDLQTLGVWKDTWFHYYTRDLIGRRPRVLIQELSSNTGESKVK